MIFNKYKIHTVSNIKACSFPVQKCKISSGSDDGETVFDVVVVVAFVVDFVVDTVVFVVDFVVLKLRVFL